MVKFDAQGLIPAVVQDATTRQVLMLGYMNREALERTLTSGQAWFWSRSRRELWHKGATSGNFLNVRAVRLDCDGDTVLVEADPVGPTCHTGVPSCFFNDLSTETLGESVHSARDEVSSVGTDGASANARGAAAAGNGPTPSGSDGAAPPGRGAATAAGGADAVGAGSGGAAAPGNGAAAKSAEGAASAASTAAPELDGRAVEALFAVIQERQRLRPEGSYVARLLDGGVDRIAKKIGEEATEVVIAAKNGAPAEITWEVADLWFHSLVLLAASGLTPADIWRELDGRRR